MELREGMRRLTDELRIITGISAVYGSADAMEECHYGALQEGELRGAAMAEAYRPVRENAVYDLASVTKLFTAIAVLQLMERGALRLTDPIGRFAPDFIHCGDVRIVDLLAFRTALSTDARIDAQPDRDAALAALFTARVAPRPERRFYTDMGAMVLKYVVEGASGLPFYAYLRAHVLLPLGMTRPGIIPR